MRRDAVAYEWRANPNALRIAAATARRSRQLLTCGAIPTRVRKYGKNRLSRKIGRSHKNQDKVAAVNVIADATKMLTAACWIAGFKACSIGKVKTRLKTEYTIMK